ncbi:hypothetical protein ACE01N_12760 [Saccharicrinis sp. FJH2]|uniref:hypothetical protein n=1 Tax=Saccharicrinis sp. FJH65 TaxID=3344659 RepID=UPI0035F3330A
MTGYIRVYPCDTGSFQFGETKIHKKSDTTDKSGGAKLKHTGTANVFEGVVGLSNSTQYSYYARVLSIVHF